MLKTLLDYFFACDNSSKDDECIVIMISVMFFLMARHEEISKDCVKILRVWWCWGRIFFCQKIINAKYNIALLLSNYISSLLPGTTLFPFVYNVALSNVRTLLVKSGISMDNSFSLHSFRVGAVSEAVNGGLISDSDVQRHARWKSLDMVFRYHCQSLDHELRASRILLISRI